MTVPPRPTPRVAAVVVAFVASLLLLLTGRVASAHNTFVSSDPADGAVVVQSPTAWTVEFTKSVPLESASAEIVDASGIRTDLGGPRHGATDNVVIFDVPVTLNGPTTARWRLVGTDGHVISGRVSFTVDSTGSTASTTPTATTNPLPDTFPTSTTTSLDDPDASTTPEFVRAGVRLSTYLALILVGGLLFTEWFLAEGAAATSRGRRILRFGAPTLMVAPIFGLAILADDLSGFGGGFTGGLSDALSLTNGRMLALRILIGAILAIFVFRGVDWGRLTSRTTVKLATLLVFYGVAVAYSGHSRSQKWPVLGIPADVAHLASIAVWLGGLITLILVVIPQIDAESGMTTFRRFSKAAEISVIVVVASGLVQSIRLHGGLGSVVGNDHGRLLLVKVLIVLVMLGLARQNRRLLLDRGSYSTNRLVVTRSAIVRASMVELVLGGITLAVAAFLVSVAPS